MWVTNDQVTEEHLEPETLNDTNVSSGFSASHVLAWVANWPVGCVSSLGEVLKG